MAWLVDKVETRRTMANDTPLPDDRHRKLGARHRRRVVLLLQISCAFTSTVCLGWSLFFATDGRWSVALAFAMVVFTGLMSYRLATVGRIFLAGTMQFSILYALICGVCAFLDVPTEQVARTTHLFLLPAGAGAYMGLRGAKPWLRHGVVTLFFVTFILFASTSVGWHTNYVLSDAVRVIGSKIDTVAAIGALFMVMYVMQADVEARNAYETDLRMALNKGQLSLYYQPQVDQQGQLQGAEALLRWFHPRRGMISPAEFIPLAEKTGLIEPMGLWVIKTACEHLKKMAGDPLTAHLTVAVNVSAHQLSQPDFVVQVLSIIEQSGIPASRLKLELTESVLMHNMEDAVAKMSALKKHGVTFSLDDFGTGYSSLAYLKRLPLDQLKIDQAFVRDLLTHPSDLAIASTVVNLGKTLHLNVIAEGVETAEQRDMLSSIGCRYFQGYWFGKPGPFEQLLDYARRHPRPAMSTAQQMACSPLGADVDASAVKL
jgi:EAL domain-containing protein (putative c-di-GMP-specific phosphodiesterase class I)